MKLLLNVLGHPQEPVIGEVEVTLSRRNLLALLHKLDWEGSARTISKMCGSVIVTVVAEDNDEHYGDGEAGVMHDETERFITDQEPTKIETRREHREKARRERLEEEDAIARMEGGE